MQTTPETPPTNYLGRRFQLRMMSMIGLLALVLVAIDRAKEPSSWYWLTGPPRPHAASTPHAGSLTNVIQAQHPNPTPAPEVVDAVAIPATDLEPIQDDSVGLRSDESGPYHRILARARDLPDGYLSQVATNPAFSVLQNQPEHFRGQVISVAGDLRRLMRFPIRENDQGITVLYEALIFTADSGTTPYRIRLTSPPSGLPTGRVIDPAVPVRVVGYFFKRDQYIVETDLRVHSAPMLLARHIERRTDVASPSNRLAAKDADRLKWTVTLFGVVVGTVALTLLWTWHTRSGDRRFANQGLRRATAAPDGAIEALDGIETVDPEAFFREMSRQDQPDNSNDSADDA
jgi:hypothetical protein